MVDGAGAAGLVKGGIPAPGARIRALLEEGCVVLTIDPFLVAKDSGERAESAFADTFMPTDTGYRVQDVLTAIAGLRALTERAEVRLEGWGDAGIWCLLAAALDETVAATTAEVAQDMSDDGVWVGRFYVPCIRGIGDLATAAALVAPRPLHLVNAHFGCGLDQVVLLPGLQIDRSG